MRIGSFFLVLLVALVALGFFLSDGMHLREDIDNQQKEIEKLTTSLQKTEQEKQNALAALQTAEQAKQIAQVNLQNTSQNLQSCRQEVDQANQLVVRLTDENTVLKEQNHLLITSSQSTNSVSASIQHPTRAVQSTDFSLITLLVVGLGSVFILGLKSLLKKVLPKRRFDRAGSYIYLTSDEIKGLAQRRRSINKANSP